mmetsp:Transcript_64435/g.139341  ORF Transcript_64435/g.139341 Transcript_64435/m.139341 type:complete len:91 (+) Transcript_64435:478-750(+)|eukprot:CAMPEP_0116927016 /NCGR_PEP_ID=MMETSP0467-20121206/25080_1 /TAXON_ID=283647 /ORGANISM="Mesodinium pulex, Strain SPMC105" /LENGTH=90 /DNA_ID=CAMNT_0004606405 /DNA_START=478 /DNA_END=750 /DNA_ORIENTATION=-
MKEIDLMDADLIPKDGKLWLFGKEVTRGKKLSDFVGKNNKTKVVGKLQKANSGAPVREPVVDKDTQARMMEFAYKRREENKKLTTEDDDT